jgi:protein involved in polysaccharide export with SLBB domain
MIKNFRNKKISFLLIILIMPIFLFPFFNSPKANAAAYGSSGQSSSSSQSSSSQSPAALQAMLSGLPAAQGLTKSQIESKINNYKNKQNNKTTNKTNKNKAKTVKTSPVASTLPPSNIEQMYFNLYKFGKPLTQFGYGFLHGGKIQHTIVGAIGDNYIIGPGDSLSIYISGAPAEVLGIPNSIKNLAVNREGMINLPYIGVSYVWGLTLGNVKDIINNEFSKRFKNVTVDVSLNKLRQFKVYVSGFVKNPGPVTVNGTYSVLDALSLAGGVSREGTLRNITVRENINGIVRIIHIDLYKLLLKGLPVNVYLHQGDVIYVAPIGETVAVKGAVKRPAIYEIKPGDTIRQVLAMAGGLEFYSHKENVKTIKLLNGKFKFYTTNLSNINFLNEKAQNGQVIVLGNIFSGITHEITVSGKVSYPGIYSVKTSPDLKSLIKKIGLLKNTNLNYAQIVRIYKNKIIKFSPEEVQAGKLNIKLYAGDKVIFYPVWMFKPVQIAGVGVAGNYFITYYKGLTLLKALEKVHFNISPKYLKVYVFPNNKSKPGSVVYLNDLLYGNDRKDDMKLLPGESLLIKKLGIADKVPMVSILGQVSRPGSYALKKGMTLYDLIIEAGGYTSEAYPKALVFIRQSIKALQKTRINETILDIQNSMAKTATVSGVGSSSQEKLQYQAVMYKQKQYLARLQSSALHGLGRISLDIPGSLRFLKHSGQNIKLVPGDAVYIPTKPDYVLVMGAVFNQIAIPFTPGKTVGWYINQAGGLRGSADSGGVYLIKANGRTISNAHMSSFWSFMGIGQNFYDMPVTEGSSIIVPARFEAPILWMPLITQITQIMFQSISTVALIRYL